MLQVALLPGIFQWLNRLVLRAQRPDSRPSRRCSHGQPTITSPPASRAFAGLHALFWVDRLDGAGVFLPVVPRT
jgi:hypothetical protein